MPVADPGIDLDWLARKIDYRRFQDCVHCGLCTASCPTYIETSDENDSPRGRIYLMRAVVDRPARVWAPDVRRHLELCLDCRACEIGVSLRGAVRQAHRALQGGASGVRRRRWRRRGCWSA